MSKTCESRILGGRARGVSAGLGRRRHARVRPRAYPGKRLLDLVIVAIAAPPALLVAVLCAIAILCEDGHPVLLRQTRTGCGGRPFTLFKLRTMSRCAQPEAEVPEADRITRVGRLLRRISLDEVPQLINVLRGEMSLVGPRPNFLHRTERYDARQRQRLAALPGLTGLAQVSGRNRLSWDARTDLDLEYVAVQSLRLDLWILVRSAWVVLTGDGVTGHPAEPAPIPVPEGPYSARHRLPDPAGRR
jgi:lipopolysaccharide/colanic/teichoic acid biosynthesis glycosyltransferase